MSQEETVAIRYKAFCGNCALDDMYPFEYSEQAPASLCKPHSENEPGPDGDALGMFLTSLTERHHDEILHSRAWRCVTCHKPARELLHTALSFLSPITDRALGDFEPTVIGIVSPICMSGGACDRAAVKNAHDFSKNTVITKPWQRFEEGKNCDKCGKRSGVKKCAGCKLIAYCSKECQTQSWPSHKRQCKRAQRELREAA